MTQLVCRGYRCTHTNLIEAHVVPRGFAKDVRGAHTHNLLISLEKMSEIQLGIYDADILCASCDGKLGDLDDYAVGICFPSEHTIRPDGLFEMLKVDGDKFATFILSVLWRASITSRREFAKVALGAYEDDARDVIFGAKPLSAMPEYQLLVGRYRRSPASYTMPAKMTTALIGWYLALGGFRILASLDPTQLLPRSHRPSSMAMIV